MRIIILFYGKHRIRLTVQRVDFSRDGLQPTSAPDTPELLDCCLLTFFPLEVSKSGYETDKISDRSMS